MPKWAAKLRRSIVIGQNARTCVYLTGQLHTNDAHSNSNHEPSRISYLHDKYDEVNLGFRSKHTPWLCSKSGMTTQTLRGGVEDGRFIRI